MRNIRISYQKIGEDARNTGMQEIDHVEREYLKVFPELTGKFSAHICENADGVHLEGE